MNFQILIFLFLLTSLITANASAADSYLDILPNCDCEVQTKPIGSTIILTCKSKVHPDPKDIQWISPQNRVIESLDYHHYKYGNRTKPDMYTEMHEDRSCSLFFNSLQEEHAGAYTCQVMTRYNMKLTKSVTIDTIIPITWDNASLNQYAILGEDFGIQCRVRGRPSPSVDWLYNGQLIKTNDHYIITPYFLMLKNFQESDEGIYTCRASVQTTGELRERPIRVEVHIRPSIEKIFSTVQIVEGDKANIECKASGKPSPMFTWIKSSTQQDLLFADRFYVDPVTGVLTITDVNREDEGVYQCTAKNAAGIATANIQVNVIVEPEYGP